MLVLTRRLRESIMVGDDIEIRVLGITRDTIKLGIQAPRHIPVLRKEIYVDISAENRLAASSERAAVDEALRRLSDQS